jgi:predicted GIY-YIG superfamily endonuclease
MEVRNMIIIKIKPRGTAESRERELEFKFEDGPYPIDQANKLKNRPGVYVILCQDSSSSGVIDVGQSDDVRKRVTNHDRKDCWRKHCQGSLKVAATYIKDEQQRLDREKEIRQHCKLPCGER